MTDEAECDLARLPHPSATQSDVQVAPGTAQRTVDTVLRTADGVRIEARHEPYAGTAARRPPGAIVVAHGFTGSRERPALRRAARALTRRAAVVTFSFRGHGRSSGRSTVGDREVLDLAAAVAWARSLGYGRVATVGFSMGGSVVLRHAALYRTSGGSANGGPAGGHGESAADGMMHRGRTDADPTAGPSAGPAAGPSAGPAAALAAADAAVAVSAPARWYYNGTAPMRRVHWAVQRPLGRLVARYGLGTRIHPRDWDPVPLPPVAAAPLIAPTPLLLVHGDRDPYFPLDHPCSLAEAADPAHTELWLVPGFGHAENAAGPALLDRVGAWAGARIGDNPDDRCTGHAREAP
ncbi:alpha/beta hydrolase [Streptomyces boncukensis]|uniref:Alpha/beta hydrolase n=1 Tax=Streptomyces boncukensis TaxID=2711219 RepID=A0A6G4WZ20_9ACTN|nr:alpha/beta hydrolase [Streptomyces boncukensis]NGO70485.1 alpha/beta hydrolase [Streptomyces boncukensis]